MDFHELSDQPGLILVQLTHLLGILLLIIFFAQDKCDLLGFSSLRTALARGELIEHVLNLSKLEFQEKQIPCRASMEYILKCPRRTFQNLQTPCFRMFRTRRCSGGNPSIASSHIQVREIHCLLVQTTPPIQWFFQKIDSPKGASLYFYNPLSILLSQVRIQLQQVLLTLLYSSPRPSLFYRDLSAEILSFWNPPHKIVPAQRISRSQEPFFNSCLTSAMDNACIYKIMGWAVSLFSKRASESLACPPLDAPQSQQIRTSTGIVYHIPDGGQWLLLIIHCFMDLQFAIDEPLDTLCFHYLLNQSHKNKMVILNSILLSIACQPHALVQVFQACRTISQQNMSESQQSASSKECLKNMAELLLQVCKKMPKAIGSTGSETLGDIVSYCCPKVLCAVAGNDFISLINLLVTKTDINQSRTWTASIWNMLMDSKMHMGSYRQPTRNQLYNLLLFTLRHNSAHQLSGNEVERVVRGVQSEKDPRNMIKVLQIYQYILRNFTPQQLQSIRSTIFDCLEAYYPIDFEGDPSKHNIDLQSISSLLDQCLTQPIFRDQLRALLQVKMASAPISKFIPTFMLTPRVADNQHFDFWMKLLLKTADEEYIQEDYEGAQYELAEFIVELLNRILVKGVSVEVYEVLFQWMKQLFVDKVFSNNDNAKFAGRVIAVLQKVVRKAHKTASAMISSFVIKSFIEHTKSPGEILYKIGMLVPVLEEGTDDSQHAALLIMSLSHVFHQSEQPQPQLLVLKVLMLLSRNNQKLVSQSSVLPVCFQFVKKAAPDPTIVKAFTDYLVQMHSHDIRVEESINLIPNSNARTYGIITLCLKTNKQSHRDKLLKSWEDNLKQFVAVIRTFKIEGMLKAFQMLGEVTLPGEAAEEIEGQFNKRIDKCDEEQLREITVKQLESESPLLSVYFLRRAWRALLCEQSIRRRIYSLLSEESEGRIYRRFAGIAYFNKAVSALKLDGKIEVDENTPEYKEHIKRLLPIDKSVQYEAGPNCSPTLIHYIWKSSEGTRTDLVGLLPTCLLSKEVDKILPSILNNQDIETLSKISKSLPEDPMVRTVLPYLIQFLQKMSKQTDSKKAISALSIVAEAMTRAEEQAQIHSELMRAKGRLLVSIEENGLQHRKRRVRQGSRKVFSDLNMMK